MTDALDLIEELLKDASAFHSALELSFLDGERWAGKATLLLMKNGRSIETEIYCDFDGATYRILDHAGNGAFRCQDKHGNLHVLSEEQMTDVYDPMIDPFAEPAPSKSGTTEIQIEGDKVVGITKFI